jgi:hypothetical protein
MSERGAVSDCAVLRIAEAVGNHLLVRLEIGELHGFTSNRHGEDDNNRVIATELGHLSSGVFLGSDGHTKELRVLGLVRESEARSLQLFEIQGDRLLCALKALVDGLPCVMHPGSAGTVTVDPPPSSGSTTME